MSDEVRPFPVDKFLDSTTDHIDFNKRITNALNTLEPDQNVAVFLTATPKRVELSAFARIGNDWSFMGFIKRDEESKKMNIPFDYGVGFRWSK